MASANVLENLTWQRDINGHITVEKSSKKEFVAIIVGRVDPQKLNCGPDGNHIRSDISPLHKAKFQFQLCQPFENMFAEDFDKAIQNLEELQAKIAETTDRRNMLMSEKNVRLIRFTSNIFEQRKQSIPKHAVYLSDLENPEGSQKSSTPVIDKETENWPISIKLRDEFNLMKLDYEASPLRLYRGESLIEQADVNEALTDAVVQVFFTIRHYYLRDKKFDTFGADIQQIKILKPGLSVTRSG